MSLPPSPILRSVEDARRLRSIFEEAGYVADNLRSRLGLRELGPAPSKIRSRLDEQTNEATVFHVFARAFLLGLPVETRVAEASVPREVVEHLVSCRLWINDGSAFVPGAAVTPVDHLLIASDTYQMLTSGENPDSVLWPSPTTELMSRFAIRRPRSSVLELGTGSGVIALGLSGDARTIVATDVTSRATEFAQFNARWNGVEGLEILEGDRFEPVAGRRFDLILFNPPFLVTPPSDFAACQNPLELDDFCRLLIREAPAHLNEGGFMQILLDWVEVEGQPWQERLRDWVSGLGCDAWVAKAYTKTPADYGEMRIKETTNRTAADPHLMAEWMAYYRERKVAAVHGGIFAMRKREGDNWVQFEEADGLGSQPFGDTIFELFNALDLLDQGAPPAILLALKPRLSRHVRLNAQYAPGAGVWQPVTLRLRLVEGVERELALDSTVASFLGGFDGVRTLRELIDSFAQTVRAAPEQVEAECLTLVRRFLQKGFISP